MPVSLTEKPLKSKCSVLTALLAYPEVLLDCSNVFNLLNILLLEIK